MHQIRHSLRYVTSKNQKEFLKDLKLVCQTSSKELDEYQLIQLEKNGQTIPDGD